MNLRDTTLTLCWSMIVVMNRWAPSNGFLEAATERPQVLVTTVAAVLAVSRIDAVLELTRRISGLVAIAVLGIAMLALAMRAEDAPASRQPAVLNPPALEANPEAPAPSGSTTTFGYRRALPPMTVVFYVYETEAQRDQVLFTESTAAMEGDLDLTVRNYYYELLDAGTPEGEQRARDAIYEAMLAATPNTRIIVEDVRGD
jgi:hypothetical protein